MSARNGPPTPSAVSPYYLTLRRSAEQSLEGLVDTETNASRPGCAVHLSMRI